jgi:hypothetical protein
MKQVVAQLPKRHTFTIIVYEMMLLPNTATPERSRDIIITIS